MSLDPPLSDAQLLEIAAKRKASRARPVKGVGRVAGAPRNGFASVTIVVPFKVLVGDNAKYMLMRGQRRMVLRPEYRAAKEAIGAIARRAMRETELTTQDVTLHAKLWMPDARRRDATNYAKVTNDSLQGIVYLDDTQIKSATYENAGIDRENPRVELTVAALTGRGT